MCNIWSRFTGSKSFLINIAVLTVSLNACAPIPIYQPPSDTKNSAHIRLSFEDESILAGVATVSRIEGDIICGEPLPNLERMIVISKGNPLITNVNPTGTYIPAGKKFTFSAVGLNDGFKGCGRVVSFFPKKGRHYEIGLTNKTLRNSYDESIPCPLQVFEVLQGDSGSEKEKSSVEITYEECRKNSDNIM